MGSRSTYVLLHCTHCFLVSVSSVNVSLSTWKGKWDCSRESQSPMDPPLLLDMAWGVEYESAIAKLATWK